MPSYLMHGGLLCLVAGTFILGSMAYNPRLWLTDYPKAIQEAVSPRSRSERRQAAFWGIPFLLLLLAGPAWSTLLVKRADPSTGFVALALHALGVSMVFNVFDLLVLDWVVLCILTPRFVVIPGTAGHAGYKDFGHHLRGFWAGTVSSVVISALVGWGISLV